MNSRKHGLTAKTLIIVGEDAGDFEQLRAELLGEYDPQSVLECELVERLAGILWRLRRMPFFEAAILDANHLSVSSSFSQEQEEEDEEGADWKVSVHFGRALMNDSRYGDALGKLARHESTLMNAFTNANAPSPTGESQ